MLSARPRISFHFIVFILHVHLTQAQIRLEPRCFGSRPFFWDRRVMVDECPEWTDHLAQQFCVTGLPNTQVTDSWYCPSQDCGCFWYADEHPDLGGPISKELIKSGLSCRPAAIDLTAHPQASRPRNLAADFEIIRGIFDRWLCESRCVCDKPTRKLWDKIRADQKKAKQISYEAGWEMVESSSIARQKEDEENECWEIESTGSTCGLPCDGQADCGPGYSCKLRKPKIDPTHFRIGRVLAFCTTLVRTRSRTRLGGRDLEGGDLCACNATYIAEACCESEDGQVWNVSEGKTIVIEPVTHQVEPVDLKEKI